VKRTVAWTAAYGVVCGLLGAGILFLVTRPPRGEVVALRPPPTPPPLVVYVIGAIAQPGLYQLQMGSRMADAVEVAGGFTVNANEQAVNLAAPLADGQRIQIPTLFPTPDQSNPLTPLTPQGNSKTQSTPLNPVPPGLVNINTATLEELDTLPGIGPITAQKIIDYRESNGPFKKIEDIQNVSDIGLVTFEKIKDLITVGG
jgi:competence protein ComEA